MPLVRWVAYVLDTSAAENPDGLDRGGKKKNLSGQLMELVKTMKMSVSIDQDISYSDAFRGAWTN